LPVLATVAIVAAFGVGFGGWKLFHDDSSDGSGSPTIHGITFAQARSYPLGTPESRILARLAGVPHVWKRERGRTSCAYYLLTDQPGTSWGFCFRKRRLATTGTIRP
jgi:hypothetical protein